MVQQQQPPQQASFDAFNPFTGPRAALPPLQATFHQQGPVANQAPGMMSAQMAPPPMAPAMGAPLSSPQVPHGTQMAPQMNSTHMAPMMNSAHMAPQFQPMAPMQPAQGIMAPTPAQPQRPQFTANNQTAPQRSSSGSPLDQTVGYFLTTLNFV